MLSFFVFSVLFYIIKWSAVHNLARIVLFAEDTLLIRKVDRKDGEFNDVDYSIQ